MTTVDCLVDLIDEITKALDEENYAISILLDLSKVFDTVNYSILLSKLEVYGIRDIENQWFRSYLNKRKQKVFVNGVESRLPRSKLRSTARVDLRSGSFPSLYK